MVESILVFVCPLLVLLLYQVRIHENVTGIQCQTCIINCMVLYNKVVSFSVL